MQKIIANDKNEYEVVNGWDDITIATAAKVKALELPEKLQALYDATISDDDVDYGKATEAISEPDLYKHFPDYYGKVIRLLTNIPQAKIDTMSWDNRTDVFDIYLRAFVSDLYLVAPQTFEPKGIKKFVLDKNTYYMPSDKTILGQNVPMAGEEAITFVEGADVMKALADVSQFGIEKLAILLAVYCRKKDEPYAEDVALQRVELFNKMGMDIAWEIFFYILGRLNTLAKGIQTSLTEAAIKQGQKLTQKAGSSISDFLAQYGKSLKLEL